MPTTLPLWALRPLHINIRISMNIRTSPFLASTTVFVAGALLAVAPAKAAEESFRYSLAGQMEYGRKLGWRLGFEDNSPTIPRHLETLGLVMAVSDGKTWRFPTFKPVWQLDHDYTVKAVIGPTESALY